MITQVYQNIYIGNDREDKTNDPGWVSVQAAKYPWHNSLMGGVVDKSSPEYLVAYRPNRIVLNLVDGDWVELIPKASIRAAVRFIEDHVNTKSVLIMCNEGRSRSPSIAFLYLVKSGVLKGDLDTCLNAI